MAEGQDSQELEPHNGQIVGRHSSGLPDDLEPSPRSVEFRGYRFAGPIPHPRTLEEYERIVPGSAAQIIAAFTKEGDHRRALEVDDSRRLNRGQWMGFILAILFFLVAGFLVWSGHAIAGTILGSVDLVGLVAVFVLNRSPGDGDLPED